MVHAAKVPAATLVDALSDPPLIARVKTDPLPWQQPQEA
jgi:hypothetical protein